MTIIDWPLSEQPREKLLSQGVKYLTDAELLAIFLNSGTHGKTAVDLARELLTEQGGLKQLFSLSLHHFCQKPGLGKAKFALLQAALELGRRYSSETIQKGEKLNNSQFTKRFLAGRLQHYPHEVFACLFLDNHHRVLAFEELFHGTLSEASVYPREVVKRGLAHNAAKIILSHNHPSGNPEPSEADHDLTQTLKQALSLVDIQIIDHVIVGNGELVSFAEMGWL